ncbi:hypothetical protein SAMN05444161_3878 [Rhizobiales bacterium GAS191]|nr:hypothetical protein SAMN05444161_3878 [Rhizobiales bacterium GAS191]
MDVQVKSQTEQSPVNDFADEALKTLAKVVRVLESMRYDAASLERDLRAIQRKSIIDAL